LVEPLVAAVGSITVGSSSLGFVEPPGPAEAGCLVAHGVYPSRAEFAQGLNGSPVLTRRYTSAKVSPSRSGARNAFQKAAKRSPLVRAWAARAVPAIGSTQCQAWAAPTKSKVRPAESPALEGRYLDFQAALSGEVGHPLVRLDAEHSTTSDAELAGGDACPAADIEHIAARAGVD
jgi:hypothetical protein